MMLTCWIALTLAAFVGGIALMVVALHRRPRRSAPFEELPELELEPPRFVSSSSARAREAHVELAPAFHDAEIEGWLGED